MSHDSAQMLLPGTYSTGTSHSCTHMPPSEEAEGSMRDDIDEI